jgi:hypothetical protein
MTTIGRRVGIFLLALGLFGCGGSIKGGAPDGSTQPGGCASLSACACYAAGDHCKMNTESCWCPSECNPNIACVCGGGRFLGCEDSTVTAACDAELARVKALCAGTTSFAGQLGDLCVANHSCIAGCLAALTTVDSCSQIDCSFCIACDCAPFTPSQFSTCVNSCNTPPPPLR